MTTSVQRLRPGEPFPPRVGTIVVIDALRMTTTAAVLMRSPSRATVSVAATLADLPRLSLSASDCVVISELVDASWPGAWVDNSPVRVATFPFAERTPVLVTTNGTRALLAAAACADHVRLASFVDLHAVARHLRGAPSGSVALLPAGHFVSGARRTEDDLCADALAALLAGDEPDLEASAWAVRADPRVRVRAEANPSYAADVECALREDRDAAVLGFAAVGMGVGRVFRV